MYSADVRKVSAHHQLFLQGEDVDRLVGIDELLHRFENQAMRRPVKIAFVEDRDRLFRRTLRKQHRAQRAHLSFETVKRNEFLRIDKGH